MRPALRRRPHGTENPMRWSRVLDRPTACAFGARPAIPKTIDTRARRTQSPKQPHPPRSWSYLLEAHRWRWPAASPLEPCVGDDEYWRLHDSSEGCLDLAAAPRIKAKPLSAPVRPP